MLIKERNRNQSRPFLSLRFLSATRPFGREPRPVLIHSQHARRAELNGAHADLDV